MSNISSRCNPINDLDPSCERTRATLGIYNIDPDSVTNKLGIPPTLGQKKGAPSTLPSGKVVTGTVNSWLLSSEHNISSKDIRTHLDWLLDKIEPVAAQLHELQQLDEVKMAIRCLWVSAEGGGGPTLWPEQMGKMAKLNLECNFSFAYYGDD